MTTIKIRTEPQGEFTELRMLINHPMENGRNRDLHSGELIPAHFIKELTIQLNGELVMTINMAGSMAKNPFFTCHLYDVKPGDNISVAWLDNLSQQDRADYIVS